MSENRVLDTRGVLRGAVDQAAALAEPAATDDELISLLTVCEEVGRQLDRITVSSTALLQRRGAFVDRGYRNPALALSDLLGWDRFESRRRFTAAEQVFPRIGLDGTPVPARLPATAGKFGSGRVGLRHVEVIARLMNGPEASRLDPDVWAGVEAQLAEKADCYTPTELQGWGHQLLTVLDQDGPEPDDTPPPPVNELHLRPHGGRGGGTLAGRLDDAALYDAIAAAIDAAASPRTADDQRPVPQRQAEALADLCGYVLDHGPASVAPERGGRRPHLNVLIGLEDLQARARGAFLDFGGQLTPQMLRMLACDAAVVPIVLGGDGQPLDVGRATRTIPDGLRRAIAARDRGCAYPGCGRPASWAEIHHVVPWESGGETSLANCVMVCRAHHRLLHADSGWLVRIVGGLAEFVPPRWIDPQQRPRRRGPPLVCAAEYRKSRPREPVSPPAAPAR